jgi:hypothetical protein
MNVVEYDRSYLMTVGRIHRNQLSSTAGFNMLFPGLSIHKASQTSPRTLANEVPISAKITSEKYMGPFGGGKIHLRIALRQESSKSMSRVGKEAKLTT